jgi:mannose-6-phosphate isomerase-like protein (cupin superfamily)
VEEGISRTRLAGQVEDRFFSLRRELGVSTFGINQIVLAPREVGRVHRHERQEEVYYVVEGTLTVRLENDAETLGPGELIRIAPGIRRQLVNHGPDRLVLVALGGAAEHNGRDGMAYPGWETAYEDWSPPQDLPRPADLTE